MDLVDKVSVLVIEHRFSREKFAQKKRTVWPINSSETRHDSAVRQNKLFGFPQYPAFFVSGFRRTDLIHVVSIVLRVYARATCEKKCRPRERSQKILRAVQVNAAIFFRVAAAGAGALKDYIEFPASGRHRRRIGYVNGPDGVRFGRQLRGRLRGSRPSFHFPFTLVKKIGRRRAYVAATGNQDSRHLLASFS
jgi:hypothetical protein